MASFLKHCCDRTWQKCQPCSDIIITLSCSLILSAFSYFRTVAILKLKYNWNVFTEDDTLCKRRLASALDNKLELQLCSSTLNICDPQSVSFADGNLYNSAENPCIFCGKHESMEAQMLVSAFFEETDYSRVMASNSTATDHSEMASSIVPWNT